MQHHQTIDKHIQHLGFKDIYAFALEQLITINEQKLEENNSEIEAFEEKYQMNFSEFDRQFHEVKGDHFEKEDDSMEWEVRLAMKKELAMKLLELNSLEK